jgi:hypothetical protein
VPTTSATQPVTPSTPAPTQATDATGITFPSVVGGRPGQTATVTVQTAPGASCSIA